MTLLDSESRSPVLLIPGARMYLDPFLPGDYTGGKLGRAAVDILCQRAIPKNLLHPDDSSCRNRMLKHPHKYNILSWLLFSLASWTAHRLYNFLLTEQSRV